MSFLNDYICAKTKRSEYFCDFLPFPSLLSFFTPTCRVCTSGLSYADVITKFPGIYRFYSLLVWGSAVILIKCSLNKCSAGLFRFPFTCETSWMILIWTFLYIVPFCIGLACEKSFRLGSGEESFSLLPPPSLAFSYYSPLRAQREPTAIISFIDMTIIEEFYSFQSYL